MRHCYNTPKPIIKIEREILSAYTEADLRYVVHILEKILRSGGGNSAALKIEYEK